MLVKHLNTNHWLSVGHNLFFCISSYFLFFSFLLFFFFFFFFSSCSLFSSFLLFLFLILFFFFFYGASPPFRAMAYPVFFLQVSVLLKAAFQFPIWSKCTAFLLTASSHSSFIVSHRYSFFPAEHPPITYWGVRESSLLTTLQAQCSLFRRKNLRSPTST